MQKFTQQVTRKLSESTEVGDRIWQQLSIGTKMAIGAREPKAMDNELTIRVGSRNAGWVKIILTTFDTYDVQRIDGKTWGVVEEVSDVPLENLNSVVYSLVNR